MGKADDLKKIIAKLIAKLEGVDGAKPNGEIEARLQAEIEKAKERLKKLEETLTDDTEGF